MWLGMLGCLRCARAWVWGGPDMVFRLGGCQRSCVVGRADAPVQPGVFTDSWGAQRCCIIQHSSCVRSTNGVIAAAVFVCGAASLQVTTLLSKEQENRQQQSSSSVSPEQLKALQEQVSVQGGKVKDAKAVSTPLG